MSNDKESAPGGRPEKKPIDLAVQPLPEPEGTDMGGPDPGIRTHGCTQGCSKTCCPRNSTGPTDDD